MQWVEQLNRREQRFVQLVVGSQARRGSDNFCACFTDPSAIWSPDYGSVKSLKTPRQYIEAVTTYNVSSGIR